MAKPSVTFMINKSTNDVACSNPAGDSNWIVLEAADKLCWRDSQQTDQDLLSGSSYPVVIPLAGSLEAPKTFLKDDSAGKYQQIPLAGTTTGGQAGGNTRYVFAAYVGGTTATTPYLEAWDSEAWATSGSKALGNGTAMNSTIIGMATTNGAPGSATWSGTPLAGSGSRIALDTGAIGSAKYVYWNLKQVIPSTAISWSGTDWALTAMALALHYTYS